MNWITQFDLLGLSAAGLDWWRVRFTFVPKSAVLHLSSPAFTKLALPFLTFQYFVLFPRFSFEKCRNTARKCGVLLCISFVNTSWSCYPDLNWGPHPYQRENPIFYNYFSHFMAPSAPIRPLSVTLESQGFRPFRRPLWLAVWSGRRQQASRSDRLHKGGQSITFHT